MTPPPNTTAPENAPAAAPRGDDRPASLDASGDQGLTVSTTALSEYGPVIASILAAESAP